MKYQSENFFNKNKRLLIGASIVVVFAIVIGIAVIDALIKNASSEIPSIEDISVGYHLTMGTYEQDGDTSNGAEPIEWQVLDVKDGKALLLSDKLMDYVPYNDKFADVTWETCTLRQWMNDEFLNTAFTSEEQSKIATVTNENPDNLAYGTKGGNATQDKVFALSIDEAEKYFKTDKSMIAYTTDYAHAQGYDEKDRSDWWWLRSPGYGCSAAACVNIGGGIMNGGILNLGGYVDRNIAIRVAFWLNL